MLSGPSPHSLPQTMLILLYALLALLRVFNNLLLTVDSGKSAVPVLLDLTAAYEIVDHSPGMVPILFIR